MKRSLLIAAVLFFVAVDAHAAKTTYIASNHRFNFVKLTEVSPRIAEERLMTHPATVNEQGLRAALASVKLSRSFLIKKEIEDQQVFDEPAINFFVPAMVTAFAQAKPIEEVVISYLSKYPLIIIRNDRLNIASAWIHENELHLKFSKLYALVTLDVDKRGNEAKAANNARGLRVNLEIGPGQRMAINDPEELILDMNYNYAEKPKEAPVPDDYTMAGEKIEKAPDEGEKAEAKKEKKSKGKEKAIEKSKAEDSVEAEAAKEKAAAPASGSVEDRLQKLQDLKSKGLITQKEYETKRKEILDSL